MGEIELEVTSKLRTDDIYRLSYNLVLTVANINIIGNIINPNLFFKVLLHENYL